MSRIIAIDWETFYDKKLGYDIRNLGGTGYCNHPLFSPYLLSVSDGVDTWSGSPKDFNWDSLTGNTLLAHNFSFDGLVLSKAIERGLIPKVDYKEGICTADLSAYICNRRSLVDACEFLLGVRLDKTVRNDADGKTEADLRANVEGWKAMLAYGRSDALNCWRLYNKYGHCWPQHERELSRMTREQGWRGVKIDVPKLNEYIGIAHGMLMLAESTLPWIAAGRPPTSPKAIAELCRKEGIPTPPVKSREGEEAFLQWESIYSPKFSWVANVANWRSINKFLDTLQTIKQRLTEGGILPFSLKYFGAVTGRWSGDGGLNFQNFRRDPIYRDTNGFMVSDAIRLKEIDASYSLNAEPPYWVTAVLDIRSLIIPRDGTRLIIPDLSQIEPRVLAYLTGNQAMLDLMASGQSPYEAYARNGLGWTGGEMKKENKKGYSYAKACVLKLGYGCGWQKFIAGAAEEGLNITKDDPELVPVFTEDGDPALDKDGNQKMKSGYGTESRRIVKEYRDNNPKIVSLWKQLDDAFRASVGGNFEMELPSGRKMRYGQVRQEWRTEIDPETNKGKRRLVYTAMVGDRRIMLYGGLLVAHLVSATARDVFGYQILGLSKNADINILFSVHDELPSEVTGTVTAKDIEQLMSVTPPWLRGCPLAAEATESLYYKK